MRNLEEKEHDQPGDVLEEIEHCGIFYIKYRTEGEWSLFNPFCRDFPLILNTEDLRQLGQQLIEKSFKDS